jgi:hypothetical protein
LIDLLPPDDEEGRPTSTVALTPEALAPLQLRAEVTAYASRYVQASVNRCVERVKSIVGDGVPPYVGIDSRSSLRSNAETALLDIRDELQEANTSEQARWLHFVVWLMQLRVRLSPTAPALFFYVRFDHGLLDAVDGEGVGAVV